MLFSHLSFKILNLFGILSSYKIKLQAMHLPLRGSQSCLTAVSAVLSLPLSFRQDHFLRSHIIKISRMRHSFVERYIADRAPPHGNDGSGNEQPPT